MSRINQNDLYLKLYDQFNNNCNYRPMSFIKLLLPSGICLRFKTTKRNDKRKIKRRKATVCVSNKNIYSVKESESRIELKKSYLFNSTRKK